MQFVIDGEEYLTQDDLERLLNVKQTTINTLVRFGHMPAPLKLEVRKLWKRSEIEDYLNKTKD